MRIGVLGTGDVGKRLATRFAEVGHSAEIGTRDVAVTQGRDTWFDEHPLTPLGTLADVASWAEVIVNANGGDISLKALNTAGAGNLDGKILIDVSNPLDFSDGFPPKLFVKDTDSLGERIQREFPSAKVVKTLCTVNNQIMAYPKTIGDSTMFVAGNDADAKTVVNGLLGEFGWEDILDLGGIDMARGMEMNVAFWVRIYPAIGHGNFNIKVVR